MAQRTPDDLLTCALIAAPWDDAPGVWRFLVSEGLASAQAAGAVDLLRASLDTAAQGDLKAAQARVLAGALHLRGFTLPLARATDVSGEHALNMWRAYSERTPGPGASAVDDAVPETSLAPMGATGGGARSLGDSGSLPGGGLSASSGSGGGLELGRYTDVGPLATGGMATVWVARKVAGPGLFKPVALKQIREESFLDPTFRQLFLREASVAFGLSHPNLVQTFDVFEVNQALYIEMELIDGCDLSTALRHLGAAGRRMAPAAILDTLIQALKGLSYLHEQGLIHRDIKPSNIFITRDGTAKLGDFGVAKGGDTQTLTAADHQRGTPCYMSPEQALGTGALTFGSDLFAVGLVLYELLTGRRLLDGANPFQVVGQLMSLNVEQVRAQIPEDRRPFGDVLCKLLAPDVSQRLHGADELLDALYALKAVYPGERALRAEMAPLWANLPVVSPTPSVGSSKVRLGTGASGPRSGSSPPPGGAPGLRSGPTGGILASGGLAASPASSASASGRVDRRRWAVIGAAALGAAALTLALWPSPEPEETVASGEAAPTVAPSVNAEAAPPPSGGEGAGASSASPPERALVQDPAAPNAGGGGGGQAAREGAQPRRKVEEVAASAGASKGTQGEGSDRSVSCTVNRGKLKASPTQGLVTFVPVGAQTFVVGGHTLQYIEDCLIPSGPLDVMIRDNGKVVSAPLTVDAGKARTCKWDRPNQLLSCR